MIKLQKQMTIMNKAECMPKVIDYGMMIITNYNEDLDVKSQSKKVVDPNNENEKIAGYFIMEKYDQNVE
jgi:hypothetical protein